MARRTWSIIDAEKNLSVTDFAVTSADLPGMAAGCSAKVVQFHGGLREGVLGLEVNQGTLRYIVLPTRGMGIWKAWVGDLELGWKSPTKGPVHPQFVNIGEPSGLGWIDGFDEALCRCGLESNGRPDFDPQTGRLVYPLHGKIANRPAQAVDVSFDTETATITVRGTVDETRFHFAKLRLETTMTTKVGEPSVQIVDRVTNLSGVAADTQLLYHANFGQPFLGPGARAIVPHKEIAPWSDDAAKAIGDWGTFPQHQERLGEQVYFFSPLAGPDGQSQAMLKSADGMQAISVKFDTRTLPYFVLWRNPVPSQDGYVSGLEPSTNFPNPRSFEQQHGRVVTLPPGGSVEYRLTISGHVGAAAVAATEAAIAGLQGSVKPIVHTKPRADWCG